MPEGMRMTDTERFVLRIYDNKENVIEKHTFDIQPRYGSDVLMQRLKGCRHGRFAELCVNDYPVAWAYRRLGRFIFRSKGRYF